MDIPKNKDYDPVEAVQCDGCGGCGCQVCDDNGWLTPQSHVGGRRCANESCDKPLNPDHVAVYCSSDCAFKDI